MDYYQILGISENADQEEIKKSYRRLAAKHHPDKGGDTAKFQEISAAYDTLSDPQKKAQYDAQRQGGFNNFEGIHPNMGGGFDNLHDIFNFAFGPGFAGFHRQHRQSQRNKDLTIRVTVSFKQSYLGTQIEARYKLPSGKEQTVAIDVPPGVQSGQVIRYQGLGDDSIPNLPRGNLNVNVMVEADQYFQRRGSDLYKTLNIDVFEAMLGCTKEFEGLDGKPQSITIRPGIQHGTEFVSTGKGFRDVNTGRTGNFVLEIAVEIPAITDPTQINQLKEINAQISKISE